MQQDLINFNMENSISKVEKIQLAFIGSGTLISYLGILNPVLQSAVLVITMILGIIKLKEYLFKNKEVE